MIHFFLSIFDWLSPRKWIARTLLLLFLVGSVLLILRLHYQEDIAAFLPHDEKNEKITEAYQQIGGQDKIVVIFHNSHGTEENADSLIAAMETFSSNWQQVDTTGIVKNLQIRVDDSVSTEMLDFVYQNFPYFLTETDYQRIDSLLAQPNYVVSQLKKNKELLSLPTGNLFSDNIRVDPLHIFTPVLQRLQSFQINNKYDLYDNCVFTDNWHKGLVFFNSPYSVSESEKNGALAEMLDRVIRITQNTYPHIQISAIGAPLISVNNAQQIKHDGVLAVSLSVILILSLLLFSFKRISDLVWIVVSVVFGWIFALGGMAIYNDEISIIVLGIGSVIIGIAINYPLHFLDHLKDKQDKRQVLKDMIPPLLIGNITTVGAFLCLAWMKASAMRDLGIFGSLVMIGTILFVLVFLPLFAKSRKYITDDNKLTFGRIASFSLENKKYLFWPVLVLTVVLGIFSLQTSFDSNLQHINYMTDQQKQDIRFLSDNNQKKGQSSVYAFANGKNMEDALQSNEQLQEKIDQFVSKNKISSVSGINNFILSEQKQKKAIDHWQQFLKKYRSSVLDELKKVSAEQGFSENAFSPFISLLDTPYQIRSSDYFNPIRKTIGDSYFSQTKDGISIIHFIQVPDKYVRDVKQALNTSTHYFAFTQEDVGKNYVNALSFDFNYVGYACGFIVFFFLWLSFGRLELSLISFLPLAVSWLWILGIMQIFNIQFNIVNIILATFIFGQGDDYTIFITDGLISEYAYGKKTLASYKNSVALSALIMFVGMGTLIFAKHPAMRSLGEVTIIGMFTVVLMAYYFPPLLYKWMTTQHSKKRDVPLTIQRLSYSIFSMLFFLVNIYLVWLPYTFIYFHIGKPTEKKHLHYHRLLCRVSKFIIHRVPGVRFSYQNISCETFEKPAVIICNHQSHLDLMCLMMLSPKIVILTNDWVWNNPFYGMIIKHAEFYPVSDGIDANLPRLKDLTQRGYSVVIFPEGTRSEDGSIQRFHRGAFYLAEKLQLDILPIFVHGVGHILPKKDFMLRKGRIYMEIMQRITPSDTSFGSDYRQRTKIVHHYYQQHFEQIKEKREDASYYLPYVKYKYMYKGAAVEARCRKTLNALPSYEQYINHKADVSTFWILNSGQGEIAWLFALVNKKTQVLAFEENEEDFLLATNCSNIPANLHFYHLTKEEDLALYPQADKCIELNWNKKERLSLSAKYQSQRIMIK